MKNQFARQVPLLTEEGCERLQNSRVLLFGLGGVGGHAAEALARSGVGHLTLVDGDTVGETDINRQILALRSTLGMKKTDAAKNRILDINPDCDVATVPVFFAPGDEKPDFSSYDYVIDAIDSVPAKLEIVRRAVAVSVPVISAMGAGNKLDPCAFRVSDLSKTSVCPLAKIMRTSLRKEGILHVKTVYSEEIPREGLKDEEGHRVPASVSFVPGAMGLAIAGEVIRALALGEKGEKDDG